MQPTLYMLYYCDGNGIMEGDDGQGGDSRQLTADETLYANSENRCQYYRNLSSGDVENGKQVTVIDRKCSVQENEAAITRQH